MRIQISSPIALACLLAAAPSAFAQDGKPIDIDVATPRVAASSHSVGAKAGGGGKADDEDDAPITEDTLPPKGNPKRVPGLHVLARRYVGGKMWTEACARFDQIVEESGKEAMDDPADAKKNAGRAYFECAERAMAAADYEKVEALLKKSESFIPSDERHQRLRRKIQKEQLRKSMMTGDLEKAMNGFNAYQAAGADEDARIWMGEQLAKMCWEAYNNKDKARLDRVMGMAKKVAPMNAELRKLEEKIEGEDSVMGKLVMAGLGGLALVGVMTQLSRWRARAKLQSMAGDDGDGLGGFTGKKNKFIDDD